MMVIEDLQLYYYWIWFELDISRLISSAGVRTVENHMTWYSLFTRIALCSSTYLGRHEIGCRCFSCKEKQKTFVAVG